jgi:A/G-specific adenine glycosylase
VKRVFARVFGIDTYPGERKTEEAMWARAEALLPESGIESYTQGLMDMGATLCTRSSPDCTRCPMQPRCVAFATERTKDLPVRKPKKATPEKQATMLLIVDRDEVLLEQRPGSGIWGGLLSLPELDGHNIIDDDDADADGAESDAANADASTDADAAVAAAAAPFGVVESQERLKTVTHVFTHYKLHIAPLLITLSQRAALAGESRYTWLPAAAVVDAALPAPIKKLLLELLGNRADAQARMF